MNADLNESETLFSQSLIDGFNESVPETHAESVDNSKTGNEPFEHVEIVTEATIEKDEATVSSNDSTLLSDICTTQIESKLFLQSVFV